jgi:hypothetical protein
MLKYLLCNHIYEGFKKNSKEAKRREVIELDGAKRWKNTFVVFMEMWLREWQRHGMVLDFAHVG